MALHLTAAMSRLTIASPSRHTPKQVVSTRTLGGFCNTMRGQSLVVSARPMVATAAKPLTVEAKQNSKRRERTAEKARMRNKARKSAISTRMKKVLVAIAGFKGTNMPKSEEEIKPVEKLISEAYQEIDKAVSKGTLHQNTGARRKQRLALAKRKLLISAKLYTPTAA